MNFIKWIFRKAWEKAQERNEQFLDLVRTDFGIAVVIWVFCTSLSMVFLTGLGTFFIDTDAVLIQWMLIQLALAVMYFVFICVMAMYAAYKKERHQLFETIKSS